MEKAMMNLFSRSKNTWHPAKGVDTTTSRYWLNWRLLLCCAWILTSMGMAVYLIKRYEGPNKQRLTNVEEGRDDDDSRTVVYVDDSWKPCMKQIHPLWLMAFRVFAFFVLILILTLNVIRIGGQIFLYYTNLTFTLLIIYFGFGSLLSVYGCYHNHIGLEDQRHPRRVAGFWGYSFQITFQIMAGAVVLTDCIFWFIIVPFLSIKYNFDLDHLTVALHSTNALFLLGDAALNSLQFPWFRVAYFLLWTCFFVVFQWIIHASIFLWWPYPFLDLSSSLAPLWYLLVALLHIPCYGVFFLVIKLKHFLLKAFLQDR